MALQYTNGTIMYTDMGSPAAFDDLTAMSVLMLVNVGALSPGGTILMAKKTDGGTTAGWRFNLQNTSGQVAFNRRYASDATNYISGDNLMSATGTWRWVACAFDQSASAGNKVKLYAGPYGGSLVETATYSTATDAASGANSDAALTLRIGGFNTATTTTTPTMAAEYAVLYGAQVSLVNLQAAVDSIQSTAVNSYTTGLLAEWKVGYAGGTTADDITAGNNDGTTTTATNTTGFLEYSGARRSIVQTLLAG